MMAPAARASFPATRHSLLDDLRGADAGRRHAAGDALCAGYWRPVYSYLRLRWGLNAEDAEDATQSFLAYALHRAIFDRYDPARARFRTFLRVCLDRFVANERKAAQRAKRGGGASVIPLETLDFAGAEADLAGAAPAAGTDVDALFHAEWVRHLFARAVNALRLELRGAGREHQLRAFERYDLADDDARPTYAALAAELGTTPVQVTNHLAAARRAFRRHVLDQLRALTGSEAEFRAEARELLGVDPPSPA
ncbi:MAG TPA: hypothetical protein VNA89_02555 [Gemmatimonadaceae bacterium]|nr:hypothetical protein [Gemmatimonadaceae bacterium]